MKYLPSRNLDIVTNALNFSTPDCHIIGGCDAYTTKTTGKHKRLLHRIDKALEAEHQSLVEATEPLRRRAESEAPEQSETSPSQSSRKSRSRTPMLPRVDLSRASPFGPLSLSKSKRTFAYLITTLNASHPDYEFSYFLRPSDFRRERSLNSVMQGIDNVMHNMRPKNARAYLAPPILSKSAPVANSAGNEIWTPRMWSLIDKEMGLQQCEIYIYRPDNDPFEEEEGTIWNLHYFFFNKERKRVCYLYLRCLSVISHSPTNIPTVMRSKPLVKRTSSAVSVGDGAGKRASYWLGNAYQQQDVDGDAYEEDDDEDMVIEEPGDDEVDVPYLGLDEIRTGLTNDYYNYDVDEDDEFDVVGPIAATATGWPEMGGEVRAVSEEAGEAMEM